MEEACVSMLQAKVGKMVVEGGGVVKEEEGVVVMEIEIEVDTVEAKAHLLEDHLSRQVLRWDRAITCPESLVHIPMDHNRPPVGGETEEGTDEGGSPVMGALEISLTSRNQLKMIWLVAGSSSYSLGQSKTR